MALSPPRRGMEPSFATMRPLRRALILLGVLAIVAYLSAAIWLVVQQRTTVLGAGLPSGDRRPAPPFEEVWIDQAQGPRQRLWLMRTAGDSASRPWLLFLHGNASNVASRLNILHCEKLRALGLNVIAAEYRGFGGMDGAPTEAGLESDARSGYDYLRRELRADPRRIVVYGWSLGSAVAVDLTSRTDEAAVILEGAPSSLVAVGARRYPYFPIRMLIRNPFDSIRKIVKIRSPGLFLPTREDDGNPVDDGVPLVDACA